MGMIKPLCPLALPTLAPSLGWRKTAHQHRGFFAATETTIFLRQIRRIAGTRGGIEPAGFWFIPLASQHVDKNIAP
jgi:ABC-type Fe3+ transport system permease subunit